MEHQSRNVTRIVPEINVADKEHGNNFYSIDLYLAIIILDDTALSTRHLGDIFGAS